MASSYDILSEAPQPEEATFSTAVQASDDTLLTAPEVTDEALFSDWVVEDPVTPANQMEAQASGEEQPAAATSPEPTLQTEAVLERLVTTMQAGEFQAVISVVAPPTDSTIRAPLRLVAVLDKSGSMRGDKLRLVKETMLFMLRHLSRRDALGIVEYDTCVSVAAPLTRCDEDGKKVLQAAIKRLKDGSQTNLSGGLLRGLDLHRQNIHHKPATSRPMQRLRLGNSYKRLSEEEAAERSTDGRGPAPDGAQRIHEWTMELRFEDQEDADLVQKVVYSLHPTFKEPVVEVREGPCFSLTRLGWGFFVVRPAIHLHDGRVLLLEHELRFDQPETFHSVLLPLHSCKPLEEEVSLSSSEQEHDAENVVVRSTFLFTDGLANVGITNSEELCVVAEAALGELGDERCSLSTFGFGDDHNADLLQGLADKGSGIYSYVDGEDRIGAAFGEALGGLLSTTHQNVDVSLMLSPGIRLARPLATAYPVDDLSVEGGAQVLKINVGDLFAEERRDVLATFVVPEAQSEGSSALGQVRARGFSVHARRSEETASFELVVQRQADAATSIDCHPQVMQHRMRIIATEALEAARKVAQQGSLSKARQYLLVASESLRASPLTVEGDEVCLRFLADINECSADLKHEEVYRCKGSKKMAAMHSSHGKQRSCYGQDFSKEYSNSTMRDMKTAFEASIQ